MHNTFVTIGSISITWAMLREFIIWIILGSGIIEWFPPIKFKPWSWCLQKLGSLLNKDMCEKINEIEKNITELSDKVDRLEEADNEMRNESKRLEAMKARRRILVAGDEIRRNSNLDRGYFSEEYYNDILQDITDYNNYCSSHPNFENERAVVAIKVIKDTYQKCLQANDFL